MTDWISRNLPSARRAVLAVALGALLGHAAAGVLDAPGTYPGARWAHDSHCAATLPIALGAQAASDEKTADGLSKHYPECFN